MSKFFTLLLVFMPKSLVILNDASLERRSSHIVIGIVIYFDKFLEKSLADCEDLLKEPSILIGLPTTIPLTLFSMIISLISFNKFSNLALYKVVRGVAIT